MSSKHRSYLRFQEAQRRDAEPCAKCGHPRGQHVGDKHCVFRQVNQCTCSQFTAKEQPQ